MEVLTFNFPFFPIKIMPLPHGHIHKSFQNPVETIIGM